MKVIVYARIDGKGSSTNDQEAADYQVAQLVCYAKKNGLKVAGIVKDYCSGLDMERPHLDELLDAKVDAILVRDITRIGRNALRTLEFINELKPKKILCYDTGTFFNDSMLKIIEK